MHRVVSSSIALVVFLGLITIAAPASAQQVEVGASLVNVAVPFGDGDSAIIVGVPSASFSLLNPGVYASFKVAPRLAVEGQVGLLVLSGGGSTDHLLNLTGQVDYFLKNPDSSAPYVFGTAGVINVSGSDGIGTFGGGAGYRIRQGDRLALRIDGRYSRFTSGGGNSVSFAFSIGGLFGG